MLMSPFSVSSTEAVLGDGVCDPAKVCLSQPKEDPTHESNLHVNSGGVHTLRVGR